MSSSDDKKLPTSTLARSFSAQLNDIFLLDDEISKKEREVENKKLELTQQNAELDALEARLKAAEVMLAKAGSRNSLSTSAPSPTPANTEVGNPFASVRNSRRRNPLPTFADPSAEDEAQEEGEGDINDDSAPEPPKKDNPVALQAPRALPEIGGEIEARRRESEEGEGEWGGGGGTIREVKGDVIGEPNIIKIASTIANVDVPKSDKIEISFNQKEQPKLSDGQGLEWPAPQPQQYNALAAAAQPSFPPHARDEIPYENRRSDPENMEHRFNNPSTVASINGQHEITVKPDEDGDERYAGDLIDQYGLDDDNEAEQQNTEGFNNGSIYANQSNVSLPTVSTNGLSVERKVSAVSNASTTRSDSRSEVSSVSQVYAPAPVAQESTNIKYLAHDLSFPQPPIHVELEAASRLKTELPPLPGQTSQIPKRKPLRSSEEASRPEMSFTTSLPVETLDRPPTPPSKAPRSMAHIVSSQYNFSDLSIASNSTGTRPTTSIAPSEAMVQEKPLPMVTNWGSNHDGPKESSRDSGERGFGGLLKMKKSLQGLRKKAQTAVSSPISPSNDPQRNYSPTSSSLGHPAPDPRAKDEPPLPPIPPEKLPAGVTLHTIQYQPPLPPPPQMAPNPAQPDIFDRVQASFAQQQQQQQQQQQHEELSTRKFEGKHKKAVEAIAKFSGKMSALRSLRKREGREGKEVREEAQVSQEPPLADWEIEQRAHPKPNPYGFPASPPQTAYPGNPPQATYPGITQTWNPHTSGYGANEMMNSQLPMSPPQAPIKDDALPPPPPHNQFGEDAPPTPSKVEPVMPVRKELPLVIPMSPIDKIEIEIPSPQEQTAYGMERPTRTTSIKPMGFSIFPSPSTARPILPEAAPPPPPSKEFGMPKLPVKEVEDPTLPLAVQEPELPPPAPEKAEQRKPAHLQLSASNLAAEKPQPSPGLMPPVSPGFVPGRGGRVETYSFLGDYYFTDNPDGDESHHADTASSVAMPATPRSPPREPMVHGTPPVSKGDSDPKGNYRIKSFAPFSLGDFGLSLSFDGYQPGPSTVAEDPVPPLPEPKSINQPISFVSQKPTSVPVQTPAPVSLPTPAPAPAPAPVSALPPPPKQPLPAIPVKDERRSPVVPEPDPENSTPDKKLPEPPKTVQRVSSKPELREKYATPLQTVAHRSILTSSIPTGRQSESPPLPMKDIPEEGPYPPTKPSPLSSEWTAPPTPQTSTNPPITKAGYASSGVSSVRSSSGYTETPSATASTPRTSLSSGVNGSTTGATGPASRVTSGEHGPYPTRNSSHGYQQQQRPSSQEAPADKGIASGPSGPPPNARPPNAPPGPVPPRGRAPGPGPPGPQEFRGPPGAPQEFRGPPGAPPELRGRPGFRPPPGGPMGPGYPPRSASPAFSERSMRPRGPPPPRSASPAFSERSTRMRGPPPPRSASPAFSMRGDPRMHGPPRGPPPQHQRKRSNSMEILDFAADFELPSAPGLRQEFKEQQRRSRSESIGYGSRPPPPGAFRGRAESPGPREGFRSGSRAGSRGPPGVPPGMGSRPGSRAESPFRHPPHHFNGPPRMPAGRRDSNASNPGGSRPGSRRPSMSEADLDIALGVGQIPGQERKYRPPPQMRGGRAPPAGGPPPPAGGSGRGGMAARLQGNGLTYPGLDDAFGMMDGGRMPTMTGSS
ncbi:hypothetical protein ABW19_dt0201195 [Dactylella cylindrospora]|nr:hypothetical protein ABW19_dt0201195 [Dactylella cylindrospora]